MRIKCQMAKNNIQKTRGATTYVHGVWCITNNNNNNHNNHHSKCSAELEKLHQPVTVTKCCLVMMFLSHKSCLMVGVQHEFLPTIWSDKYHGTIAIVKHFNFCTKDINLSYSDIQDPISYWTLFLFFCIDS